MSNGFEIGELWESTLKFVSTNRCSHEDFWKENYF